MNTLCVGVVNSGGAGDDFAAEDAVNTELEQEDTIIISMKTASGQTAFYILF